MDMEPTYEEILTFQEISYYRLYNYGIYRSPEGLLYNVDKRAKRVTMVRDPGFAKFQKGETVLVIPLQEYGEIVEVKQDLEWGNHQYAVEIFNDGIYSGHYRDEHELKELYKC